MRERQHAYGRDIAITGIGCRLPGGLGSLEALWSALEQGRDLVGEIPPERFDPQIFADPNPRRPGRTYTASAGVLDDIASFDAEFFGISPREAARMDPQQRLLLELTAEAVDDAALAPDALSGTPTGVFVGMSAHTYANLQLSRPEAIDQHTMTGIAGGNTANRISHAFDLRGPSLAVDTACSSSLVALHQACELLRSHGGIALAAGVNVLIGPHEFIGFSKASMLSPTGRCRAFSAAADGFVRAEGGVVLVLRPLAEALADGDRVHAVITATGTNSDGRTPGLALPSARAQAELLRTVYERAGLDPGDLLYVEAHGTGTPAGDPLECEAIGTALAGGRPAGRPLPIGSVKTNIGHLEPASGLAGLLKAVLVLRHRTIPASLHGTPVSEAVDFPGLGLAPVHTATPLPASGGLVGVNSFGFGGSNAHAVLAPAPAPARTAGPGRVPRPGLPAGPLPLLVSARTPAALAQAADALARRLESVRERADFYDIAHTGVVRRGRHPYRTAVLAADAPDAVARLRAAATVPAVPALAHGEVAFVYSGNGAQWAGMGARLLTESAPFRDAVAQVDEALLPLLGWSVSKELATADGGRQALTEVAQPLLFAVQAGLTAALAERGVRPAAVCGHSVGEIAAAHACGALDLASAARVVAERSLAQARTAGSGRMAAAGLTPGRAEEELAVFDGRLELAAVNSPQDVTLSGDEAALEALACNLAAEGTFFRMLGLDHAFHSRHMDTVEDVLRARLAGLRPGPGRVPFASTVTGALAEGTELTADYWWRNVRRPVLLADAVRTLLDHGCDAFVEIGPQPVLGHYLRRTAAAGPAGPAAVLPTLSRDHDGADAVDDVLTTLLASGARVDRARWFPVPGRVADLPAYPWQRERHWHGTPQWWLRGCGDGITLHPLLGERADHAEPLWHTALDPGRHGWLADHVVGDTVVMPAAAFAEAALAAGRLHHNTPVQLQALAVDRALVLPFDDDALDLRLQVALDATDGTLRVSSREGTGPWREHARAVVRRLTRDRDRPLDLQALRDRLPQSMGAAEHYARLAGTGIRYGPAFRVLTELRTGPGEVLARYRLTVPDSASGPAGGYGVHPSLLDGALQAGAALLRWPEGGADGTGPRPAPYLPAAIESVHVWDRPPAEGWIHVRHRETTGREACWDISLLDDRGNVTAALGSCRLRRFETGSPEAVRLTNVLRAAPRGHDPDVPPHRLPGPGELARAALQGPDRPQPALDSAHYTRAAGLVGLLSAHFTLRAAHALDPAATSYSADSLIAAGAHPHRRRLLDALLAHAARNGLLRPVPGGWSPTATADPGGALAELLRAAPGQIVEALLHTRAGTHLTDILLGHRDPVEVFFDDAGRQLMADFYSGSLVLRHYNALAAALTRRIVHHWPAGRPLRVLEVGAGTGGLTTALLDALPSQRTHYTYTDVSEGFLPQARHRFGAHDHVHYATLDIDQDPAGQGFHPASYDLVVAGNALHTAADLRRSLGHLTGLLDGGGHLLALEAHNPDRLLPVFGLLDGYWNSRDDRLRAPSPLLASRQWHALLTDSGFEETARIGAEDSGGDYSVLLARRAHRPRPAVTASPRPADATSWIIATEDPASPLAEHLATALRESCAAPVAVVSASTDAEQWAAHLPTRQTRPIVVLLPDAPVPPDADGRGDEDPAVLEQAVTRTAVLRAVARACVPLPPESAPVLWLVTRPSGAVPAPGQSVTPRDAVPWAVARTLANEQVKPSVRRLSLERTGSAERDARRLARELLAGPPPDDEISLTSGGRFVTRVHELPPATAPAGTRPYRLRLRRPGLAFALDWVPDRPRRPGPGQVAIEVRAAGLNYRDVMLATDLLPPGAENPAPDEHSLGLECAGVVTATGPDTGLTVGDRVFAFASGSLASHVIAPAAFTGRIPDELGFARAATMPAVFFTVHHALEHLARPAAGETVLIHGAAGGVGLAALQYALHTSARVIATAGTSAKRDLLELLGADHVLDSRTLAFADDVMELTGGAGVDVVLNSLSGEAIARNLDILRPGGRCVELGKRDIHGGGRVQLRPFRNNLSFHAVDAHQMLSRQPELAAAHFAELTRRTHQGVYRPLPHQEFPAAEAMDAFTALRHSRHVGKLVIGLRPPPPLTAAPGRPACDPDATYLVTGGLTGLGAATAEWLAGCGARHLALAARRGAATPGAGALVARLADAGATATVHAADVADPASIGTVLDAIGGSGHPLRGVVHSAMALQDDLLTELGDDAVRTTLGPKLRGTAVLDALTRGTALDFFVVHSSISALVGHRAQASYAAANLYMEGLVRRRRAAGLPGLAVGWGLIGDVGSAADERISGPLQRMGLGPVSPGEAMRILGDLLTRDLDVVQAAYVDWPRLADLLPTLRNPAFGAVLPPEDRAEEESAGLRRTLADNDPEAATAALADLLARLLARVTHSTPERVDRTTRLNRLGLDSLMATELVVALQRELDYEIPALEVINADSINDLAGRILTILKPR
ncbi:SDR family NAD(P)-dependent oxidoreductase [Streptomyces olivoreticuli]